MSQIKVWLHFVWSTKDRMPLLKNNIRNDVFEHIRENARKKSIFVDFINGYFDHVHCLVSLGSDQTIEKIMQLIKGESSHWINQNRLCPSRFQWQDDYFVVSVSESLVDSVRNYIKNQEIHHRNRSFDDEYEEFPTRAGFIRLKDIRFG
jgi:REP element-mobilizing transposase RayT